MNKYMFSYTSIISKAFPLELNWCLKLAFYKVMVGLTKTTVAKI